MQMVKKNNWSANGFGNDVSPDSIEEAFLDVDIILLLNGTNLFGDAIYSYIQLSGRNLKAMFTKMQKGENFKPSDFGTVLAAGRGQPTKEVRDEIAAEHNMIDVPMPSVPAVHQNVSQPKFFGEE